MDRVKVFVGTAANDEDLESQAVLEYTMRKHATLPVDIEWMKLSADPKNFWYSDPRIGAGWATQKWATPFSGFRWGIPAYCNYRGRGIYMDSDMIIKADIAQLWTQEMAPSTTIVAKGGKSTRQCVMVWDCAEAQKHLPPIDKLKKDPGSHRANAKFFGAHPELVTPFIGNWNCIDGENYKDINDPEIKILHYSSMSHQPHLKFALPRLRARGLGHWFDGAIETHNRKDIIELFEQSLTEAIAAGYTPEKYASSNLYGGYKKQSQVNYKSNKYAR